MVVLKTEFSCSDLDFMYFSLSNTVSKHPYEHCLFPLTSVSESGFGHCLQLVFVPEKTGKVR